MEDENKEFEFYTQYTIMYTVSLGWWYSQKKQNTFAMWLITSIQRIIET